MSSAASDEGEPPEVGIDEELLGQEDIVDLDERAETVPGSEPISFYGTDFDVFGLVRRFQTQDIVVPSFDPLPDSEIDLTGFQRRFVWRKYQMDRFVESLLLGYPVPGIFLVQHPDKRLLVLDGQQRLRTLGFFFEGVLPGGKPFALESVRGDLEGLTYLTLSASARRTLENTFIHGTIVRYDGDRGGRRAVYDLFERLNSGGTNLYPQEIRVALSNGALLQMLRELNNHTTWRNLYGPVSGRLKDQELVLRFVALYYDYESYARPLKGFLNDFLEAHRQLEGIDGEAIADLFRRTCDSIDRNIGRRAFRTTGQVNAAQVDAIMHGVAKRIDKSGEITDGSEFLVKFDQLISDPDFLSSIARATADEDRVERRLGMARAAFAGIQ